MLFRSLLKTSRQVGAALPRLGGRRFRAILALHRVENGSLQPTEAEIEALVAEKSARKSECAGVAGCRQIWIAGQKTSFGRSAAPALSPTQMVRKKAAARHPAHLTRRR